MTDKYDLTTARGVLLALADGHELHGAGAKKLFVHGYHLFGKSLGPLGDDSCVHIAGGHAKWRLAPKHVDSMDVPDLAVEMYGVGARESTDSKGWPCVTWFDGHVLIAEAARNHLANHLRVLVRAKRAGEL